MAMAIAVQQTEHVINTVLYKYMENTTDDVVLHVFDISYFKNGNSMSPIFPKIRIFEGIFSA